MNNIVINRVRDGYTYEGCTPSLEVSLCGGCGIMWGAPEDWLDRRRDDGQTFYCPNGCPRVYRKTEADRLREQLEAEKRRTTRLRASKDQIQAERDHIERRRRAAKGELTKVRRRVANGICPSCNRHFADLHRHMQSQHPGTVESEG